MKLKSTLALRQSQSPLLQSYGLYMFGMQRGMGMAGGTSKPVRAARSTLTAARKASPGRSGPPKRHITVHQSR